MKCDMKVTVLSVESAEPAIHLIICGLTMNLRNLLNKTTILRGGAETIGGREVCQGEDDDSVSLINP